MIEVKVSKKVNKPQYQKFETIVMVHGFDTLTPKSARAALEIAFGINYGGEVWSLPLATKLNGIDYEGVIGYRVYQNSARKLYFHDL